MFKRIIFLPSLFSILLLWSWWMAYKNIQEDFHLFFLLFAVLFVSVFFISVFKKLYNLGILLFSFSLIIIFLEFTLFFAGDKLYKWGIKTFPIKEFYFDILPTYSASSVSFDNNMGYRWSEENVQVKKMAMENVLFDIQFKGNNYGRHSRKDYFPKKENGGVKRWIVFGDSFTDAYYLKRGWADVLDSLYKASGDSVELYSFSVNGGGVKNWHQIYTQLIQPNFEFDGVIFAVFGNDLARDFFVMHNEGDHMIHQYYDSVPDFSIVTKDIENQKNTEEKTVLYSEISTQFYSSRFMNYLYRRYLEIKYAHSLKNSTKELISKYIAPTDMRIDDKYFTTKYNDKYFLLSEMLLSLRHSQKSVVLMSMPDEYGISLNRAGKTTSVQQELIWLSKEYGTEYIDGYKILLSSNTDDKLHSWFIPLDGHWTQAASDSFAVGLYRNYSQIFK